MAGKLGWDMEAVLNLVPHSDGKYSKPWQKWGECKKGRGLASWFQKMEEASCWGSIRDHLEAGAPPGQRVIGSICYTKSLHEVIPSQPDLALPDQKGPLPFSVLASYHPLPLNMALLSIQQWMLGCWETCVQSLFQQKGVLRLFFNLDQHVFWFHSCVQFPLSSRKMWSQSRQGASWTWLLIPRVVPVSPIWIDAVKDQQETTNRCHLSWT